MSTELTTEKQFQEKIQERIRLAIGDLMPDEALAGIVAKGIEKAFFEKKEVNEGYGRSRTIDPWFVEFIRKEMQVQIDGAVHQWMRDNSDKVQEVIRQTVDQGVMGCVVRVFQEMAREPMRDLQDKIQRITDGR